MGSNHQDDFIWVLVIPEILVNKQSKLQTNMENDIKYHKIQKVHSPEWMTYPYFVYINEHDVP